MLQATHYGRRGERAFGTAASGMLVLGEDSIFDKLKSFFTPSTPQPPPGACATGTAPDPSTGASIDMSKNGACTCPDGTAWDGDVMRCVQSAAPATAATPADAADAEAQMRAQYSQQASSCNPNTQYWDWDSKSCVAFPVAATPQQKAAVVAVQQAKAVTAPAAPKKFFDVKNPMMWAAIAGGVVVVGGGYAIFRRKPAATAVSARRRRR